MKRLGSSDSLGALMSICPTTTEEHSPANNHVYEREIQSMMEGLEQSGHVAKKKLRLSAEQVYLLERSFEAENKIEPERKVKLAQKLGLQPQQVAVWFKNYHALWKTKQRVRPKKRWWGPRQSGGRRRQRVAAHEAVKLLSGAATATA